MDHDQLSARTLKVKTWLDARPGAVAEPRTAARGTVPLVLIYKLMGKMFALLSVRSDEFVILKADPGLVEMLKDQYSGVGHRSHLDPRHWISISLDADVPLEEVERLIGHAYDLVAGGLTRKQKAELAALGG